jgi:hypothetical protein
MQLTCRANKNRKLLLKPWKLLNGACSFSIPGRDVLHQDEAFCFLRNITSVTMINLEQRISSSQDCRYPSRKNLMNLAKLTLSVVSRKLQ